MIQVSIISRCDNCGEYGNGIGAHRWIPGEYLPKPDIPEGWQLVNFSNGQWQSFCPNCKLMKGATK